MLSTPLLTLMSFSSGQTRTLTPLLFPPIVGPRPSMRSGYFIGFRVLALAAMLFSARDRRGYGPFLLAVLAASGVLLGKFAWDSPHTLYGAIGLLVVASLWNSWPRRDTANDATRS